MSIVRDPTCPRCEGDCGFWGSGMKPPTLYCPTCGWNEEDRTTSTERCKEYLSLRSTKTEEEK